MYWQLICICVPLCMYVCVFSHPWHCCLVAAHREHQQWSQGPYRRDALHNNSSCTVARRHRVRMKEKVWDGWIWVKKLVCSVVCTNVFLCATLVFMSIFLFSWQGISHCIYGYDNNTATMGLLPVLSTLTVFPKVREDIPTTTLYANDCALTKTFN